MAKPITYADKVKRQWNKDLAVDYSYHREFTIQMFKESKREDVYSLLRETAIPIRIIESIIQKPGNIINITLDSKNAIRIADILEERPEVKHATAHGDDRTNLTMRWVPIDYPQKHLDKFFAKFGIRGPAQLGFDKHGIKDGKRMRCAVSYDGQIQTCSLCTEQGHKYRECPDRPKSDTNNSDVKDSPTSTTEQSNLDENELTYPTKESHEVTTNTVETIPAAGAPRMRAKDKRAKNVERNPPAAASLSKDSLNHVTQTSNFSS
ncbi:unnamed protein product [Clavelina lepadiformis]|uniref:CCHC-type domain-containing protein n=1 Tax=Clavelina lepadiformis TaxID=159417 RepID=A0ABP0FIV1_CLALP